MLGGGRKLLLGVHKHSGCLVFLTTFEMVVDTYALVVKVLPSNEYSIALSKVAS